VLEVCPELLRFSQTSAGIQKTFEGSSLETIRHMVASGIGITVLPRMAIPAQPKSDPLLRYVRFEEPVPSRRVTIAWRKSYSRAAAVRKLREAVLALDLEGVTMLPREPAVSH
jgi:LysR family hydrogen peroxide-inducible transcriptional activator